MKRLWKLKCTKLSTLVKCELKFPLYSGNLFFCEFFWLLRVTCTRFSRKSGEFSVILITLVIYYNKTFKKTNIECKN